MKRLALIVFFISLFGCNQEFKYENKIKVDVTYIADDKLEGRETGSKGEQLAAAYISERFKELGLQPKGTNRFYQSFNFKPKTDPHSEVAHSLNPEDSTVTGTNVLGYLDNQAENTIIIGAHYDHLGYGSDGSLHRGEKEIHNGADDNASGVAIMLDLAARLKQTNTSNNYLFMAFSGEEMGLLGSNYFTKNATMDLSKVNYMINMDMVGRLKEEKLWLFMELAPLQYGNKLYQQQIRGLNL